MVPAGFTHITESYRDQGTKNTKRKSRAGLVGILVGIVRLAADQLWKVHLDAPADVPRVRLLARVVAPGGDVAVGRRPAGRAMVVEELRLHGDALEILAAVQVVAVLLEHEVEGRRHGLDAGAVQDVSRARLREAVHERTLRAHGVVHDPRMRRIRGDDVVRLREHLEEVRLRHGRVVQVDHSTHRVRLRGGPLGFEVSLRKVRTAMAHPEDIPLVAIG